MSGNVIMVTPGGKKVYFPIRIVATNKHAPHLRKEEETSIVQRAVMYIGEFQQKGYSEITVTGRLEDGTVYQLGRFSMDGGDWLSLPGYDQR